jgi:hypothetical protein
VHWTLRLKEVQQYVEPRYWPVYTCILHFSQRITVEK